MSIGAFFFTQTQSDQNPHTKWAIFSTSSITFLKIGGDRKDALPLVASINKFRRGLHVLKSLQLHVGLFAIVAPPCIHEHSARETARRAHHDAFGNDNMLDRGAQWRNHTDGGG